jgi:hypothetical protein
VKPALIVPVAASIALVVEVGPVIWIARLKTDREAIFQASASRTSNAATLVAEISVVIALAVEASAVTVLVEEDLAAPVIASAVEHSAAVAVLADSAAAEADARNKCLESLILFSKN